MLHTTIQLSQCKLSDTKYMLLLLDILRSPSQSADDFYIVLSRTYALFLSLSSSAFILPRIEYLQYIFNINRCIHCQHVATFKRKKNCIILWGNMFSPRPLPPPSHPQKIKYTITQLRSHGSGHDFSTTVIPNSLIVGPP